MRELMRVFSRKTIMILLILCFVNTGIFMFCADPDKEITLTGEELSTYLEEYPDFLERTISNSRTMAKLVMYRFGFAKENLVKVTECYNRLQEIQVRAGDNRGLVLFIQYGLTDIFILVFLLFVVMQFFTERKKGLTYVVRSTQKGRGILFLQRLVILSLATILGTVVLQGGAFLGSCITFGVDDMSRSIQSLPEFVKCPYPVTIGEYILYSCVLKAVGGYLTGVLLYVILGIFGKFTSYVISGALIVAEVLTAIFVTPISALNVLRYVNLISLIQAKDYFISCVYLNLFGKAVPALQAALWTAGIILAVLMVVGFAVHGKMYVSQVAVAERLLEWVKKHAEEIGRQRTLIGWECHKLCIRQGGLFILLGVLIIQIALSFQYDYYYPVPTFERLSYVKYEGELTEETVDRALNEMQLFQEAEQRIRDAIKETESKTPLNNRRYMELQMALETNLNQQDGLRPVIEDMQDGLAYTKRTGNRINMIEPYTYDLLINRDVRTKRRASFLELVVIIGSLSGIYAFEKQNHMKQMLYSSYRGRWVHWAGKPMLVCAFCGVIGICIHAVQIIHVGLFMQWNGLNVPVQSLRFMREFPIYTTVTGYFVMLFIMRILMAVVFGLIMAAISNLCADRFTAIGQGTLMCMLGISLSELIPALDFANPIYLLCADFFR